MSIRFIHFAAATGVLAATLYGADSDLVSAVSATHPLGYYRFDATKGKSLVGSTEYKSSGGVTTGEPGATGSKFAKLDGKDGYILTTLRGGVGTAATMMAWVNLDSLPSQTGHIFYVAGESEYGNDLDMQFETDDALRFFTASGGRVEFRPAPTTLVHQWHMIVATLDEASHARIIYWDGKHVAADQGGGRAGKKNAFSIGASTVFSGRFFQGGINDAALWDRALTANEVATIYAAASKTGATLTTTAKVSAADSAGPVALKPEEKIALMFLTAIEGIERDCQSSLKRACTLDEMLPRLKYDPKVDSNYGYTVAASGTAYEVHASAKKAGLIGFCFFSRSFPTSNAFYNPSGTASAIDKELGTRSIEGDSFQK